MDIKNSFDVPLPVDVAWRTLLDIKRIAPCMPGAELLEIVDPKTYKGRVSVRLGPVALSFLGTARFEEIDEATHCARVKAQGTDSKGRGGANSVVRFALSPIEAGTKVDVDTQLSLSGSVAQYGRGSGMIQDVAAQIIAQFAVALRDMLARESAEATPMSTRNADASTARAAPPPPAKPISGLTLMMRALYKALRRLFGGEPS
jgi:carbon monoxide dehydrogenase subunit G